MPTLRSCSALVVALAVGAPVPASSAPCLAMALAFVPVQSKALEFGQNYTGLIDYLCGTVKGMVEDFMGQCRSSPWATQIEAESQAFLSKCTPCWKAYAQFGEALPALNSSRNPAQTACAAPTKDKLFGFVAACNGTKEDTIAPVLQQFTNLTGACTPCGTAISNFNRSACPGNAWGSNVCETCWWNQYCQLSAVCTAQDMNKPFYGSTWAEMQANVTAAKCSKTCSKTEAASGTRGASTLAALVLGTAALFPFFGA